MPTLPAFGGGDGSPALGVLGAAVPAGVGVTAGLTGMLPILECRPGLVSMKL